MSEFSPSTLSHEDLTGNKNLLYLTTLESDKRLEELLEKGDSRTEFAFHGASRFILHPTLLQQNHIMGQKNYITHTEYDTLFSAYGCFDTDYEKQPDGKPPIRQQPFYLRLMSDASETMSDCIIQGDNEGSITVSSKQRPDFIEPPMTLEELASFSLCAADMRPDYIHKDFSLDDTPQAFDNLDDIATLWKETALSNEGYNSTERKVCYPLNNDPATPAEIRIVERFTELPDRTRKDITIEHVTRLHQLDAQIIYYLELTYESTAEREQLVDARKHVVSGSERILTNAQLSCIDTAGTVTPLGINDATVMKHFKTAIESVLQKSQTSLPTLG
jgi:hypothetical protein